MYTQAHGVKVFFACSMDLATIQLYWTTCFKENDFSLSHEMITLGKRLGMRYRQGIEHWSATSQSKGQSICEIILPEMWHFTVTSGCISSVVTFVMVLPLVKAWCPWQEGHLQSSAVADWLLWAREWQVCGKGWGEEGRDAVYVLHLLINACCVCACVWTYVYMCIHVCTCVYEKRS